MVPPPPPSLKKKNLKCQLILTSELQFLNYLLPPPQTDTERVDTQGTNDILDRVSISELFTYTPLLTGALTYWFTFSFQTN